jgi:hypothetical protein
MKGETEMNKSGWYNESRRHSLASKGIETGRKTYEPAPPKRKIVESPPYGERIKKILLDLMGKETKWTEREFGKDWTEKYGTGFDDVKLYTDKEMESEYNTDERRGWTGTLSGVTDKKKDSNVVLLVTYDGDGYDQFSINEGARLTDKFQKELEKRYGDRFQIEHYTNWSFQVHDMKSRR